MFARLNYPGLGWAWDDELSKSKSFLFLAFPWLPHPWHHFHEQVYKEEREERARLSLNTFTHRTLHGHYHIVFKFPPNRSWQACSRAASLLLVWLMFFSFYWADQDIPATHIIFFWLQNPTLAQELPVAGKVCFLPSFSPGWKRETQISNNFCFLGPTVWMCWSPQLSLYLLWLKCFSMDWALSSPLKIFTVQQKQVRANCLWPHLRQAEVLSLSQAQPTNLIVTSSKWALFLALYLQMSNSHPDSHTSPSTDCRGKKT